MSHRITGGPLAALAAAALSGCGSAGSAPAASTLPLAAQVRVLAAASGGSQVDPSRDRNYYRYLVLGGGPNETGAELISAEVQTLVGRRWDQERSVGFRGPARAPQPVPITTSGAEVLLDAPDGSEYVAMSVLASRAAAQLQTAGTALSHSAAVTTDVDQRHPVLWVVLGRGRHPKAS